MRHITLSTLAAALIAVLPASASAALQIGVDLDLLSHRDDRLDDNAWWGVGLRAGYLLPNPGLDIVPELHLGYAALGGGYTPGGPEFELHSARILAGARAGLPIFVVRPGAYAHVGVGWLISGITGMPGTPRTEIPSIVDTSAVAWDAGLLLDLVLIPGLDLGVHAGYNSIQTDDPVQWLNAGLHASFGF